MEDWNLADCLDAIADIRGDHPALIQTGKALTWKTFEEHASTIASWLSNNGVQCGSQVALYTHNHVAYLETSYACMKAGMVPVNINHQYKEAELIYLFENSDASAVLIHEDFLGTFALIADKLTDIRAVLVIGKGRTTGLPSSMVVENYADVLARKEPYQNDSRSGDDLIFIYTGGTTGMPKGVMWRQRDLYSTLAGGPEAAPPNSMAAFRQAIINQSEPVSALILPPLMHGTAFFGSLVALLEGGTVILTSPGSGCDAQEICSIISNHKPTAMSIVGDTFARPILDELDRGDYDATSLKIIASSGSSWSNRVKAGLLKHNKSMKLLDGLGSSEAHNIGTSITTVDNVDDPQPKFLFGANTLLVDEEMNRLDLEPGTKGLIAVAGAKPVGYYKDSQKSAQTFIKIDDRECALPGDWALVNEDGMTFTLLGRGSMCINTGGEKVFPEEVETAIRRHPEVHDAAVVGVPDERWGQAVVAIVSSSNAIFNPEEVKSFVREQLANYKVPKHFIPVPEVSRNPAGKANYKLALEIALKELAIED